MSSACGAKNTTKCRVHGSGGMYQHLLQQQSQHLYDGNMDKYIETRTKLEGLTDHNQEALDFHKAMNSKNHLTFVERIEDKLFDAADRLEEIKDHLGETVSEGVDRVTDRHEAPIPAEIGGTTVAWSDLNPFKNPFKNGKLR